MQKLLVLFIFTLVSFFTYSLEENTYDIGSDIAVVVNQSNYSSITLSNIREIFLGKRKGYSRVDLYLTIYMINDPVLVDQFNKTVLADKTLLEIQSSWAKNLYTDNVQPPVLVAKPSQLINGIASDEGGIGYLPLSQVTNDVRIVYVIRAE